MADACRPDTHDAVGNRTMMTNTGFASYAGYLWDDMGRLVSYTAFANDPNDPDGGIPPQTHTYTYRADGMRVTKLTDMGVLNAPPEGESGTWDANLAENLPTTRYLYDGQMCAMEDFSRYLGGTAMAEDLTRYGLGARGIDLVERKPYNGSWTTEFPIYDAHGNNIARLKRSGSNGYTVSSLRSYDAWGSVRSGVPSGNPTQRYCANLGHVQDDESGLVYMRARYYEPATGRFISEDPARDGSNWYVYCGNDPINFTDRTGRNAEAVFWGVISTLLMITSVLLGFGEANLVLAISRAARNLEQLRELVSAGFNVGEDLRRAMSTLNELKSRSSSYRIGQKATMATALLARLLMIKALLIDADNIDGPGGLETVFGDGQ